MNEQFSALVDGELDGKEGDALLARLKADTELQDGWDHYHLIGDAMRQNRQLDINITAAVHARLADEPTVLAPAALPQPARLFTIAELGGWESVSNKLFGPQGVWTKVVEDVSKK